MPEPGRSIIAKASSAKAGTVRERGNRESRAAASRRPRTLAIDVGGSGLKASVLDPDAEMLAERVRVDTPYPAEPETIVAALAHLVDGLPAFDRVSVGFPGVVRGGVVLTAPHFGNEAWHRFPLADRLGALLGKPVRLLNDAEVQGYGAIRGEGLEFVITLGTGLGTALFQDGALCPHMEFAQFPFRRKGATFNDYVGDAARRSIGPKKWNRRVEKTIEAFRVLLNFDRLYVGGGNGRHVSLPLPPDVRIVSNEMGLVGGLRLWDGPRGDGETAD